MSRQMQERIDRLEYDIHCYQQQINEDSMMEKAMQQVASESIVSITENCPHEIFKSFECDDDVCKNESTIDREKAANCWIWYWYEEAKRRCTK